MDIKSHEKKKKQLNIKLKDGRQSNPESTGGRWYSIIIFFPKVNWVCINERRRSQTHTPKLFHVAVKSRGQII